MVWEGKGEEGGVQGRRRAREGEGKRLGGAKKGELKEEQGMGRVGRTSNARPPLSLHSQSLFLATPVPCYPSLIMAFPCPPLPRPPAPLPSTCPLFSPSRSLSLPLPCHISPLPSIYLVLTLPRSSLPRTPPPPPPTAKCY